MTPEQEKLNRFYTYLYKNITWKHAIGIKKTLLKDGRATEKSDEFAKIVNYIKKQQGLKWVKI